MAAHHPQRIEPGPGQESVWDYPRPPRCEPTSAAISVEFGGVVVANSSRAWRVLETSQPPAYYLPPDDVDTSLLADCTQQSFCEWKGMATYSDVVVGDRRAAGATWRYLDPTPAFVDITGFYAFYAQLMDTCRVDGEEVVANEGAFYGGWITSAVVGPFKGGAGSALW
jgi:uncharacterized protein (DUF427 family)